MPGFARESWVWVHESFAGKEIDTPWFSFGYAKANPYAHDGLP